MTLILEFNNFTNYNFGCVRCLFEKNEFQQVDFVNYLQTMYDKSAELYGRRLSFDLLTALK